MDERDLQVIATTRCLGCLTAEHEDLPHYIVQGVYEEARFLGGTTRENTRPHHGLTLMIT